MLTFEQATALVDEHLRQISQKTGHDLVIIPEYTLEEDFGWVFIYNTRAFLETQDMNEAVGGNGPLIVDAASGKLHVGGTANTTEHYIALFRSDGNMSRALDE